MRSCSSVRKREIVPGLVQPPRCRVESIHPKPEICRGCGVTIQSRDTSVHGYIPGAAVAKFSGGWRKRLRSPRGDSSVANPRNIESGLIRDGKYRTKPVMMYCQRCYCLQHYRSESAIPVPQVNSVLHNQHRAAKVPITADEILANIHLPALAINIVDILDFETSIVPELYEGLAQRKIPVVTVLNKMDCLPINMRDWGTVRQWSTKMSKILRSSIGPDGKQDVIPLSSTDDSAFARLEDRIAQHMAGGNFVSLYIVGRTNSGKSTFTNRFLRFVGYKHLGCVHYKRAVGGVTRSSIPSTTRDFIPFSIGKGIRVIDTPGVTAQASIWSHLRSSRDFRDIVGGMQLQPVSYALRVAKTLLIGALCRIEVAEGQSAVVTCFVSPKVTVHICDSDRATGVLTRKAGTFLFPPHMEGSSHSGCVHPIVDSSWVKHRVDVYAGPSKTHDDISIAGLGWISISGQGHKCLDVWVPEGVKVFRRPSMLPEYIRRIGSQPFHFRNRGRSLEINSTKKALVRELKGINPKDDWRYNTQNAQLTFIDPQSEQQGQMVSHEVANTYNIHE